MLFQETAYYKIQFSKDKTILDKVGIYVKHDTNISLGKLSYSSIQILKNLYTGCLNKHDRQIGLGNGQRNVEWQVFEN